MHLRSVTVQSFRAAGDSTITCDLPGRFSLLLGSNGAGKTTVSEAIYLAHLHRFPRLIAPDAAALGAPPRSISVEYTMENDVTAEGALGRALLAVGLDAPRWSRPLERSLGRVRAGQISPLTDGHDRLRLIYLPALRNPVDELSRRETRVLIELLRAEQLRHPENSSIGQVRATAEAMLSSLVTQQLLVDVQGRIAENLKSITGGVRQHYAFIGTQRVDDTYLARVLELLLSTIPDPSMAVRLEAASLGYVNLLHLAVILAGVPDPVNSGPTESTENSALRDSAQPSLTGDSSSDGSEATQGSPNDPVDTARRRLHETDEAADADQDSFFPDLFHATVVIEEPEAHLHPQLQHGLVRYLRRTTIERPDLQIIVSTHAGELVAACRPEDLVVVRRTPEGNHVTRCVRDLPLPPSSKNLVMRMTRLHLDASRSGALFADRVTLVEGVTEAALLRVLGRVWADGDDQKDAFVDALAIVPMGHRIGPWLVQLLATNGFELVSQVAVLSDTDLRGDPLPPPKPPTWQSAFTEDTVRFFWSRPTLEPTLVAGNEDHIMTVLTGLGLNPGPSPLTPDTIDALFREDVGKSRKAEFALALAFLLEGSVNATVPAHIASMFDWLFDGMLRASTLVHGDESTVGVDEQGVDQMPGGTSRAPD